MYHRMAASVLVVIYTGIIVNIHHDVTRYEHVNTRYVSWIYITLEISQI